MSRCGDIYENKVTGEYAVILRGTEDRGQGPGIAHLTARPGAAVVGEHFHDEHDDIDVVEEVEIHVRHVENHGFRGRPRQGKADLGNVVAA